MRARDRYRYVLGDGRDVVQYGSSNDPEVRVNTHSGDRKRFRSMNVVGPATPLTACTIDLSLPLEPGSRISLRLRDKGGNLLGTLDNALIS